MRVVGALQPNRAQSKAYGKYERSVDWYAEWLSALGWKVGENVRIEIAAAEGDNSRLPALAAELVAKKADVIWVAGPEAATAAAQATKTIPIAFYGIGWPVEQGYADSLAHPGRNITGLAFYAGNENLKRLELLREIAPAAKRLAHLRTDTASRTLSGEKLERRDDELVAASTKLSFDLREYPVATAADFDAAFKAIVADKAQALSIGFTALIYRERVRVAEFALRNRLPSVHGALPPVEAGGLIYYGANRGWMLKHSWTFVDRLLRGANPAELPIELPSNFELVVNLKTARALGLAIPQSVLLRADRVIE